ncbi:hypothetical protein IscW_ISCW008977 [Ixodes scapularis]|uniref:Uncharacterized protein n=1 Tax=Ixodes scapularis TaxID=6945 RepID=B7Q3F0_IXOSC|nr:hypothetical protein IscW_ISCW008977 [Ixodes scapularis]|eukprot:XP_002411248.1 hypothetical protein IscW_ISCW008977 [Ixodes scapularis]
MLANDFLAPHSYKLAFPPCIRSLRKGTDCRCAVGCIAEIKSVWLPRLDFSLLTSLTGSYTVDVFSEDPAFANLATRKIECEIDRTIVSLRGNEYRMYHSKSLYPVPIEHSRNCHCAKFEKY